MKNDKTSWGLITQQTMIFCEEAPQPASAWPLLGTTATGNATPELLLHRRMPGI
jgi:hypothetical protein